MKPLGDWTRKSAPASESASTKFTGQFTRDAPLFIAMKLSDTSTLPLSVMSTGIGRIVRSALPPSSLMQEAR